MTETVRAWRYGMPVPDWLSSRICTSDAWIVRHPDGTLECMTDQNFRAQYEPTKDTDMPSDFGRDDLPGNIHGTTGRSPKPGYQTTEFWAMLAGAGVMVAQQFGVEMDTEATIGLAATVASYVLGRSWAKR